MRLETLLKQTKCQVCEKEPPDIRWVRVETDGWIAYVLLCADCRAANRALHEPPKAKASK